MAEPRGRLSGNFRRSAWILVGIDTMLLRVSVYMSFFTNFHNRPKTGCR